MKKSLIASLVTAAALGMTLFAGASSASAACDNTDMCGWDLTGYSGTLYLETAYTGTGIIDVPDNVIASAKNLRASGSYKACSAYLVNTFALVFTFQAQSNYTNLGSVNDTIDHLYYSTNRC